MACRVPQVERLLHSMLAAILFLHPAVAVHAQTSGSRIVGLPVFSADGLRIGQVIDVTLSVNRRIEQIRVVAASPLGFGERTVAIPQPAFIIRGGRIVLADLSADDVQALPNAPAESP